MNIPFIKEENEITVFHIMLKRVSLIVIRYIETYELHPQGRRRDSSRGAFFFMPRKHANQFRLITDRPPD